MNHRVGRDGLAIVIPVWNLPNDLCALLRQIEEMQVFSEIIVVDDASEPACDLEKLGFSESRLGARLIYLCSDIQRGAGHARNRGLEAVTQKNVIFFDADDRFTEAFPLIWQSHQRNGYPDFTIFRHNDSRILHLEQREGSFAFEETLWSAVLREQDERHLTTAQRAELCPIVAYPWNKIYRTDFLNREQLKCSETPVHNDIRLHWLSFVKARRVLALRQVGAKHIVEAGRHHLTNLRGTERLCLADILKTLTIDIRATSEQVVFMRAFLYFVHNVCQWNYQQAEPPLRSQFADLARDAYLNFTPDEFTLFSEWQPEKANAIVQFLLQGSE